MVKFCVICGKELTGRQKILCSDKVCRREWMKGYQQEYRRNNLERITEYNRDYYQGNLENRQRYDHDYYQNNRDKILENRCEFYQDNQEKIKERSNEYYQNNQEKKRKYGRNYYQNNREEKLDYERKQYRLSRGLPEDCDLRKESSLERIIREWLQENNIEFIEQYYINLENSTWTHVDFFVQPNICLYCDGGYYHLLPRGKKCDEEQDRILPQMGYNVIRLTEAEILEGDRPWDICSSV